ncbi:hypothetical protein [Paracoccus actinidiae]|uniref:hypothetical protein n=1 Tax=Paracoccus actinidiae TaxID=3064531 RepID=UPI0027D2F5DD|nr:hypothetical protein [Paracoccus sp. M09]
MMTDLTPDLIRGELARILASPDFDASERNRRFLSYVVEETLAGRADRIKAYSIATGAFGRSENFDTTANYRKRHSRAERPSPPSRTGNAKGRSCSESAYTITRDVTTRNWSPFSAPLPSTSRARPPTRCGVARRAAPATAASPQALPTAIA